MATVVSSVGDDRWTEVPATWATYLRLLRDRGERGRPKYTYIHRRLTIVSPGLLHEILKNRVDGLIEDICVGLRIPFMAFGETTYKKTRRGRAGTEADESYYLTHIEEMRGKERVVMGEDPAPDIVVEVVFSHPADDSLEVYRRFGVREVWVCGRSELVFLVLGADGRYAASATSACLPFLTSAELTPWAYRQDLPDESEVRFLFRAWVNETLAPRQRKLVGD